MRSLALPATFAVAFLLFISSAVSSFAADFQHALNRSTCVPGVVSADTFEGCNNA